MTAAATPRITPLSVAVVAAFIGVFVGIRASDCVGVEVEVVCFEEGEVVVEMVMGFVERAGGVYG